MIADPPEPLAAIARLVRVAEGLADGDPDQRWLAGAVRAYLDGAPSGRKLEDALGLACRPGRLPWWKAAALAERDALLRGLGVRFTGSATARAHQLAILLRGYASAAWRHDQRRGGPFPDTAERGLLFRLHQLDPDPPTGIRRLMDILAK